MAEDVTGSESEVAICNRALDRIGQTKQIASLDETSVAAAVCRRHFYDCADEALELRDWSFARKQEQLQQEPEQARLGWAYAYRLPGDFIAARGLIVGSRRLSLQAGPEREPHEIQSDNDGTGRILLCDLELDGESDALVYTRRHRAIRVWPRLFVSALAFRLAAELALGVVKGAEGDRKHKEMLSYFQTFLATAGALDGNQGQRDREPPVEALLARGDIDPYPWRR